MLELVHPGHAKTAEVSITTLAFPSTETTMFYVGTEEGHVYQANRYDRAGAKAGLDPSAVYRAHAGPITGLDFHPALGPIDFGDLFLTCEIPHQVHQFAMREVREALKLRTLLRLLLSRLRRVEQYAQALVALMVKVLYPEYGSLAISYRLPVLLAIQ